MSGLNLKESLSYKHIIQILEYLECEHIREYPKYFSCCNPDGDNKSAIYIRKNNFTVENYTRPEFEKYQIKDIISLVQFILNENYYNAVKIICDVCNFDYYKIQYKKNDNTLLSIIKSIESKSCNDEIDINVYDKSILDIYDKIPTKKWFSEDITMESQELFDIRFDVESERIIIPILDEIGNLVGVKGRSLNDDEDNKYIYMYECPKTYILYGLYQNYKSIKEKNSVIVVEAEKSVIKLYGHGYNNVVAIGGKSLSKHQINKLLQLGVKNITFALDKDVDSKDVKAMCKKFDIALDFLHIDYLYDSYNYMKEKDSPVDDISVFNLLLNNFRYDYVPI